MIKLARFIPFFSGEFGGPVRHILELTKRMQSYPVQTVVYASSEIDYKAKRRTQLYQEINPNFIIKRFNSYLRFRDYRLSLGILHTLLKDHKNIDIFHSHGFRTFQEDAAAFIAAIKKKKFVITTHGSLCVNISYFDYLYKRVYDLLDSSLKNKLLDIEYIAVAKLEIDFLRKFKIPEHKIHYIPHGIDTNHFKPLDPQYIIKRYNLMNIKDKKKILYVGRISKRKGVDILIKAFILLKKEIPDAVLLIAGADYNYKDEIEKIAKNERIGNDIFFLGHVSVKLLPMVYSLANVIVYPSKYEIFGHVILEANACEKPVIASNHWGPKELILQGKTGFLTSYGDIKQLKESIAKILTDHSLQEKIGKFARTYVKNNYTWEKAAKSHYDLYKRVLNENKT